VAVRHSSQLARRSYVPKSRGDGQRDRYREQSEVMGT
jgi:hypothetical protein